MNNDSTITVYIDSDPSTLGPDATPADLDRYAENLAGHLSARFERACTVEQRLGGGPLGRRCSDDEINDYVTDLEQGDGWTELLGRL